MLRSVLPVGLFLVMITGILRAQDDAIYLKNNEKKIGRVTEINASKVEVQMDADGNTRKFEKADLELILFSNGSYLTFPNEYKGTEGPAENRHSEDWLLTKDQSIIACRISNGEGDPIEVVLSGGNQDRRFEVPKAQLSAILFANGRKQFLGSPASLVAAILKKEAFKPAADFLAPFENKKTGSGEDKKFEGKLEIDQASKMQMQQRGLQKTKDLGKYLNLIANRSTETLDAEKAVDQAVALFLSDSSQVETKRPNGDRRQEFIRNYLTRLRLLKYSKVEIEWSDIAYVSNLRKAPDGNYYGVISIQQKFTGYMDNKPVFADVTRKNIEIVLKTYRKEVDGESLELWDVFLNNIGISDSKG